MSREVSEASGALMGCLVVVRACGLKGAWTGRLDIG